MTEPRDDGGTPSPDTPDPESPYAALDAREAFFTRTVQDADRLVNLAEATRVQVLLAGRDAMLLEEAAINGAPLTPDDPLVRLFQLHQANELRVSWQEVRNRLDDATRLRDALPQTWAVFLDGRTSERAAGIAARQSLGLPPEVLAVFDAAAAGLVQTERPPTIERKLTELRDQLAPEATIEAHKRTEQRRHVRARPTGDGGGVLEIHSIAVDIAAAYDRIRQEAIALHGREGECRTLGQLMVDRAIDRILAGELSLRMADGGASFPMERIGTDAAPDRKTIDATILVIVPAETATGASDAPATVAGMGSIDAEVARQLIKHTRAWTRVGVDPIDDTIFGIDSHERYIPAGLKKLLHVRTPTCTGDDCGLPAHHADWAHGAGSGATPKAAGRPCDGDDHMLQVEHDGRTRHDNLQILCRKSHQAKDLGVADVRTLPNGDVQWRNKWGGRRIVKPALKIKTRIEYPDDAPF